MPQVIIDCYEDGEKIAEIRTHYYTWQDLTDAIEMQKYQKRNMVIREETEGD